MDIVLFALNWLFWLTGAAVWLSAFGYVGIELVEWALGCRTVTSELERE
jgi:hypothetical protein